MTILLDSNHVLSHHTCKAQCPKASLTAGMWAQLRYIIYAEHVVKAVHWYAKVFYHISNSNTELTTVLGEIR